MLTEENETNPLGSDSEINKYFEETPKAAQKVEESLVKEDNDKQRESENLSTATTYKATADHKGTFMFRAFGLWNIEVPWWTFLVVIIGIIIVIVIGAISPPSN